MEASHGLGRRVSGLRQRVVVTQAEHAGVAGPLSVGVVRWRGAGRALLAVVKLTFTIAEGVVSLAREQLPLEREASPEHPSDFTWTKARCDLLLVGHAHAAEPSRRIVCGVEVGGYQRTLVAVAGSPVESIPLSSGHVREPHGEHPIRVGPATAAREPPGATFEYLAPETQQTAPEGQQLESVALDAAVTLTGLSPSSASIAFELPGLEPHIYVDDGFDDLEPIPLALDAFLVDADFQRLALTWRGPVPHRFVDHGRVERFLVSIERTREPRSVEAIRSATPRGHFFFAAEETDDVDGDPEELDVARYEALEHAAAPSIGLERYAQVTAELAEKTEPRERVLDRHGFDEHTWTIEERAWMQRMAERVREGDGTEANRFAELFVDAQDGLADEAEPRDLADYARLKRALRSTDEPEALLETEGVPMAEWMRLERHWLREAGRDPQVAEDLVAALRDGGDRR
jgi:hypothetical protein